MWMHVWCIRVDSWTSVCVHMCIVQLPDWRLACSSLLCWHFANGHLSCAFIRGLLTGLLFSLHPSPFIFYLEHFLGSKGAHIFCSGVSSVCLSSAKGHHGVTQRTFWTVCSMNEELIGMVTGTAHASSGSQLPHHWAVTHAFGIRLCWSQKPCGRLVLLVHPGVCDLFSTVLSHILKDTPPTTNCSYKVITDLCSQF